MLNALLFFAGAAVQPVAQAPSMPGFLTGCWLMSSGERRAEECWTLGNAGLMMGSGRAWRGDTIDHWEWMRIERGSDGQLTFFASPKGVPATAFKATSVTESEAVFENRAHDYPQRVRYWKTDDGIAAEVAMADGSKAERYVFKRMGGPAKKPAN